VQPDQNDPSHCELYFKEGAHGDQFGGATIEYDANLCAPSLLRRRRGLRQGRRRTDDRPSRSPATQRYNAAAHAGIGCVPMTAATAPRTETNLPFMEAVAPAPHLHDRTDP